MVHLHREDAILPLKVMATICLGRYSGLVSYSLSQDKHPAYVKPQDRPPMLPIPAFIGGVCSMTTFFIAKSKHRHRHILWLLVGGVPICMSLSQPFTNYVFRNCSQSEWYTFKTLRSLMALAVFSFCTITLALEDH